MTVFTLIQENLTSRVEDDLSSDDDSPALKRLKHLKRTNFPDIMASNGNFASYSFI